ncbi:MAG: hypothetical protein V8T45_01575 [Oscillospiraceae bacterium]
MVLIMPSQVADAKMRMFNLDGSEGRMCGNAIRCVGKYLYEHGLVAREEITIETLSGIKRLKLSVAMARCARSRWTWALPADPAGSLWPWPAMPSSMSPSRWGGRPTG